MILTPEDLTKIEEYSGLFFSIDEIAILLKKDQTDFHQILKNKKSEAYKAYISGQMQGKYKLRIKTMERAIKGSPAAEEIMHKHISSQKASEVT